MAIATLELVVPDNWHPGWCDCCPLSYDIGSDYIYSCVLDGDFVNCPLKEKEKNK